MAARPFPPSSVIDSLDSLYARREARKFSYACEWVHGISDRQYQTTGEQRYQKVKDRSYFPGAKIAL